MKITKKDSKSKQEMNIENHQVKRRVLRENLEEIGIKICLKKIKKDLKNVKKNYHQAKHLTKIFYIS